MSLKPSDVYVGFWIDWSKSHPILGATITLPSNVGALLVAFLALFVSLAATYLWNLLAFAIHYHRQHLTQGKCHPLLRQQQVIFKSGLQATSSLFRLGGLFWVNRSTSLSLKYSWLPILLASSCVTLTTVAGLYSSRIFDSSSQMELLLRSPWCGALAFPESTGDELILSGNQFSEILSLARFYSQECYNATAGKDCNSLTSQNINWATNWLAECPFDKGMCLGPATQLDTGRINSNVILGINSPLQDQIDLRKITTCAPITQDNYTMKLTNATVLASFGYYNPNDEYVAYTYGSSQDPGNTNVTTVSSTMVANMTFTRTLGTYTYYENDTEPVFFPIPKLNISNGDGVLFFIQNNGIRFLEPCDDPVFGAHIKHSVPTQNSTVYYTSDRLAGVIGCSEQYQFCVTSDDSSCSSLGGLLGTLQAVRAMPLTSPQRATMATLTDALIFTQLGSIMSDPRNFLAQKRMISETQLPIPSNQWQIELWGWHAATMAAFQYRLIQQRLLEGVISGSSELLTITPEERAFCSGQRVRSSAVSGFTNISALSFFLVLFLGTILIVTGLFLDRVVGMISPVKQGVWVNDNALHLQRLAYMNQERVGGKEVSTWADIDKDIPRVEGETLLGPLVEPKIDTMSSESRLSQRYVKLPQQDLDNMSS
ncbi:hypothetical protein GGR54DRAFT_590050 [Hypoxylon sp. NC1633]|nr:hypothetical protein GGR54DRAFT_590050 [Hypoxylon sp. NC1633]